MSDCGVCVYYDTGESCSVWQTDIRKARKSHKCTECVREISAGSEYQYCKFLYEGEWGVEKTCLICAEIRKAFCCEQEVIGNFWSDFEESFDALNESCFDKLQTAAAKKYLRERWIEWKGLQL